MNKMIEAKSANAAETGTETNGGGKDPKPNCCTAPPDGDPGPIKP